MSEYTREEILKLIEENGGSEGLDLSDKDLSGIDLSTKAIEAELEKVRERAPDETPVWYSRRTGGINLKYANLQGAYMRRVNLQGAWLFGTNLQRATLWDTNLQDAYMEGAQLQGAIFESANLQRARLLQADLQGAIFKSANLQRACLTGADLRQASFPATNLKEAKLDSSHLEKVVLFAAKSLEGAYFYNAFLDDTRMRREQLGDAIGEEQEEEYEEAREAYLALKNNFAEIGRYDDAAWAYCRERRMEKKCSAPWRARRFHGETQLGDVWVRGGVVRKRVIALPTWHARVLWFYARHTLKWLSDWFVELLCGYGESLWRVLGWMFASLLGFAAYYWRISGVWLVESNGAAKAATSFWHYLIYSAGAFTTTQFTRLQAADDRVRMVTAFQAIVGIFLAGLLGFVAGNRIRRS